MTEHEAYVAFNMLPGVGFVKLSALIKQYGSAVAAWESLSDKTGWNGKPVDWEREIALAKKKNVILLDCCDSRYPENLKDLPSPPLVLYVTGDPDVLSLPGVAIVGTRTPSLYGIEMAQSFAAGMAGKGMSVISGLATGIDTAAHKGALLAGGITIGVLGGALDKFFPDENRELARKIIAANGAVISEYPFGFPPGKFTFPQRNRIVAALSRGVLAAECPLRSGTLITCSIAKDIGRKVMAIPANINSRTSAGCWNLIKSGSLMVTGIKDVVDAVGAISASAQGARHASFAPKAEKAVIAESQRKASPMKKPNAARKTKCALTLEESSILKAVPSAGITLDRLAFSTKLPAGTVAKATMSLRIKRLLRFLPGNRVAPLVDGI